MVGLAPLQRVRGRARAHRPREYERVESSPLVPAKDVLETSRSGIRTAPARAPLNFPAVRCERSRAADAARCPHLSGLGRTRDRAYSGVTLPLVTLVLATPDFFFPHSPEGGRDGCWMYVWMTWIDTWMDAR